MMRSWPGVVAVLVALAAGAAVGLAATRDGAALNPDSTAYLGTAWNIVHRHSLTVPYDNDIFAYPPAVAARFDGKVPLTQWPPGYPVALAAGAVVGLGATTAARLFDVLALAATAGLAAALVLRIRGRPVLAAATGVAVALTPATISGYSLVLSDPLEIAVELAVLLALLLYVARPTRPLLVVISVGLAVAMLMRFAAFALLPVAVLTILVAGRASWTRRWRDAAIVGATALVPTIGWSVVTRAQGGSAARQLGFYGVRRSELRNALTIVTDWFLPSGAGTATRMAAVVVGLVVLVGAYVLAVRGRVRENLAAGGGVLVAVPVLLGFVVAYLCVLTITVAFVDAFTTFDNRYLLPLLVPLIVLSVVTFSALFERWHRPWLAAPFVLAILLAVAWPPHVRDALRDPHLFYSVHTPQGGVLDAVKHLPRDALIISNDPALLWLSSQRAAIITPVRAKLTTARRNTHLERDIQQVGALMRERCTYLVALPAIGGWVMTVDDLRTRFDLREQEHFLNGSSIWTLAGGKPCPSASGAAGVRRGASPRRAAAERAPGRNRRQGVGTTSGGNLWMEVSCTHEWSVSLRGAYAGS